jgi:pyruvate/2-oxoglutarate dehydrogenase complex dihydrolipoamide dehydrogenase (E3) component
VHTQTRICSVNPIIGHEYESRFALPATESRNVLVAGGGPGGMQTAIVAAERGHKVTLCEKSGELGGALKSEKNISFKKDLYHLIHSLAGQMKRAGVDIRLNTEVTPELVASEAPEVLVLAVGGAPIVPPLPGIDNPKVIMANDICDECVQIGQAVTVLGGGLVGSESAVHLAQEGKDVTLVEMMDDIAVDANVRHKPVLLEMLAKFNVDIRTGMKGVRITDEGLVCTDADGKETLFKADTILCAVGQRPLREVVDQLLDAAPEVVQVGDCVQPQKVTEAIYRGYHAGFDI